MILRLKKLHLVQLKEEVERVHPIEACAMLFGIVNKKEASVKKVVLTSNKLQSKSKFEIDPETVFTQFNESEKEGLDFIGIFHSHPASAEPSKLDEKYMELWGDSFWLILSTTNGRLAAFRIIDDRVQEIVIKIEHESAHAQIC